MWETRKLHTGIQNVSVIPESHDQRTGDAAVDLLRQEDARIYEVADLVGFQDYKYFFCVFEKYVGCSPTKFMKTVFP